MQIGWIECLFILLVVAIVATMAFRGGYVRGRGRR